MNHNGAACLPAALSALAEGTMSGSAECLVVDSGSDDGSWRDVERHWDRARAIRSQENIGFCAGCNLGAREARGELLAFVNFDAAVERGWDAPLRELLDDPDVAIATGLVLDPTGERIDAAGLAIAPNTAPYGLLEGAPRSEAPGAPEDVPAASGALMMLRREEFLRLGGFYEPFFMYGEETDLALRVEGRIVLHPASAVRHEWGHAAGEQRSAIRLYWPSRNRLLNAARHLQGLALVRSVIASAGFDLVTLAQVRSRGAATAMWRGWRDGVRAMRAERRARTPEERRAAARRMVSMREAIAQQARLGRIL